MKKLIMTIATMASMMVSYAITADEAIQSKNIYVIKDYCATNNIRIGGFLFVSNKLDNASHSAIYGSITNKNYIGYAYPTWYISFNKTKDGYEFAKDNLYLFDKIDYNEMYKYFSNFKVNQYVFTKSKYSPSVFAIKVMFPDFMRFCTNEMHKIEICLKFYSISKDKKYLDLVDYNKLINEKNYSLALEYGISDNDIDKIIDVLMVISDVNAEQANAIIEPINSVEASYRKDDILKGLENINSRCTIKLYDDQKTWEPILAKIRAMINLRK